MPFSKSEKRRRYALKTAKKLGLSVNDDMSELLLKSIIKADRDNRKLPKKDVDKIQKAETDFLKEDPDVDLFYQTKKNWEKTQDQEWENALRKDDSTLSPDRQSEKMDRIRWGESPLIFGHKTAKTKEFPMDSDSDKYLQLRRNKEKKKEK